MKVAALGRTRMLYDSIQAVRDAGHEIVLIGTCAAAPEYGVTAREFRSLARRLACPFFDDARINRPERLKQIGRARADAAISMNWLTLMGDGVLGAFRHGVINAHAGDLPRYRGNACPNWAILSGEQDIALTLHRMAPELDAGPVLLQRRLPLNDAVYIGDVYRFMEANVPAMFVEVLNGLEAGTISARPQPDDPAASLRCFPRHPQDAQIDWARSAEHLARLVRASAEPFAGAYTWLNGRKLVVWRARAGRLPYPYLGSPGQVAEIRAKDGSVAVVCGDGVLVLEVVQPAGGKRGPASTAIGTARARLGLDLAAELDRLRRRAGTAKSGTRRRT